MIKYVLQNHLAVGLIKATFRTNTYLKETLCPEPVLYILFFHVVYKTKIIAVCFKQNTVSAFVLKHFMFTAMCYYFVIICEIF